MQIFVSSENMQNISLWSKTLKCFHEFIAQYNQICEQRSPKLETEHVVSSRYMYIFLINEGISRCGIYIQGGLYLKVVFNPGSTLYRKPSHKNKLFYFTVSIKKILWIIAHNITLIYLPCKAKILWFPG